MLSNGPANGFYIFFLHEWYSFTLLCSQQPNQTNIKGALSFTTSYTKTVYFCTTRASALFLYLMFFFLLLWNYFQICRTYVKWSLKPIATEQDSELVKTGGTSRICLFFNSLSFIDMYSTHSKCLIFIEVI